MTHRGPCQPLPCWESVGPSEPAEIGGRILAPVRILVNSLKERKRLFSLQRLQPGCAQCGGGFTGMRPAEGGLNSEGKSVCSWQVLCDLEDAMPGGGVSVKPGNAAWSWWVRTLQAVLEDGAAEPTPWAWSRADSSKGSQSSLPELFRSTLTPNACFHVCSFKQQSPLLPPPLFQLLPVCSA